MSEKTILLADNDEDFLAITGEFLEHCGYDVLSVTSPMQARHILSDDHVDLAILDIRLMDDTDEKDKSGIKLAKELVWGRYIPKIMLTRFGSVEYAVDSLKSMSGKGSPAVDFVTKQEGLKRLLTAVQEALAVDLSKTRRYLVEHFNESELRNLCFDLRVDYESLGGTGKGDKARELIGYYERRGLLHVLVEACRQRRPNLTW
jgi:DNA-binding NtrC family response regulator